MRLEDVLLNKYPRLINRKLVLSQEVLIDTLKENNDNRPSYLSVYAFGAFHASNNGSVPIPAYAFVDKVFWKIKNKEDMLKVREVIMKHNFIHWVFWDGEYFYFIVPIDNDSSAYYECLKYDLYALKEGFEKALGVSIDETSLNGSAMMPFPGMKLGRKNKWCIYVPPDMSEEDMLNYIKVDIPEVDGELLNIPKREMEE